MPERRPAEEPSAGCDTRHIAPTTPQVGGDAYPCAIGNQSGADSASPRLTFYGVRGSTPCHGDDTRRYGGNTSSVVLEVPSEAPLLFDLGTGLRYFGRTQVHDGSFRATCLLTHLHWDHTQGLPFFTPLLCEGAHLNVYAPRQDDGRSIVDAFRSVIAPPMFPIPLDHLNGTVEFIDTADDQFMVGSLQVTSRFIPHKGPTLGYRVDYQGASVAYLSDHQQPSDGSLTLSDGALDLANGVDYLIHDAQYTPAEFARKRDWGHCMVEFALHLAIEANARTLVLFHHDPGRDDRALDEQQRETSERAAEHGVQIVTAREGLVLPLTAQPRR